MQIAEWERTWLRYSSAEQIAERMSDGAWKTRLHAGTSRWWCTALYRQRCMKNTPSRDAVGGLLVPSAAEKAPILVANLIIELRFQIRDAFLN